MYLKLLVACDNRQISCYDLHSLPTALFTRDSILKYSIRCIHFLSDNNGYVVGTNSYGKGTVQQTLVLSDGSMIKYTIEKWLTPLGNWINEEGVIPTNYVELSSEYLNNPVFENDNQLNEALELVSK